jgi:hypothetical protein
VTVPELPDVTLIAVTGVAIDATAEAMAASLQQAAFGRALLLSERVPSKPPDPRIAWRQIEPLSSRAAYSAFMLHRLHEYITTSHALCIQWDGFVVNGSGWDPRFLDYDYIGAVWPHFSDDYNVGNGGFSLRSRRLLVATKNLAYDGHTAEDVLIARTYRRKLELEGLRFAPEALARRFAYERMAPTGGEFGFHGALNLLNLLAPNEQLSVLGDLERQVLNRNEHNELLRWAISKRYFKLALLLVRRILRQHLSTI